MRKVNSKALLQPSNSGNATTIAMSPSSNKQHSMIKLYKGQAQPSNNQTKTAVNIQPLTIISKNIQARRQQQSNNNLSSTGIANGQSKQSQNITAHFIQDPNNNNNSVQTVKPSTIFSPGDTMQRKNDTTLVIQKNLNLNQDKSSPQIRQKLFQQQQSTASQLPDQNQQLNKTNELYNNMKTQLSKQKSLQSLFNTTQKLGAPMYNTATYQKQQTHQIKSTRNAQNHHVGLSNLDSHTQRAVIKRGSKYAAASPNQTYFTNVFNQSSALENSVRGQSNQFNMFKNNLSQMTRNKSAFLNFNSTQPITNTQSGLDLKVEEKQRVQIIKSKNLHNQSPSVSSEEEKELSAVKKKVQEQKDTSKTRVFNIQKTDPKNGSHQKKKSQLPNGSFIETKMKNCLHSRNLEQSMLAYQTYQGTQNQKQLLQKNQSQPFLNNHQTKTTTLTQRTTFVKTSFLRHEESRSITPVHGTQQQSKSPTVGAQSTRDDKFSSKSKVAKIQGLKGDLKSLNLSPIIPQNLGKNQQQFYGNNNNANSHNEYSRTNIASAQKRLEMRKNSAVSNNTNCNANQRNFSSMKKDKQKSAKQVQNTQQNTKDEPTTEKKNTKQSPSIKTLKYQKPGYSSQETERAPGATNSYSTADDFNLISNDTNAQCFLRMKKEQPLFKNTLRENSQKNYKSNVQFTEIANLDENDIKFGPLMNKKQESKIKVNQILTNNNHSTNQNRYNLNITPDQMILPSSILNNRQTGNNMTPRAVPYLQDPILTVNNKQSNFKITIPKEDDLTVKKNQQLEESKSVSSFENNEDDDDEEEDMPDAKDFEEFDRAEESQDSQKSGKVRVQIIEQDQVFKDLKQQKNAYNYYNNAAQNLTNHNTQYQAHNFFQKDDRNSLVNYDTSLLTHNTGRDHNSSPLSEFRDYKQQQKKNNNAHQKDAFSEYTPAVDANTFIVANMQMVQEEDVQLTKTDDQFYDQENIHLLSDQDEDIHIYEQNNDKILKTQHYKQILQQIQYQEEQEIDQLTQKIINGIQYKQLKNDKEKVKYLSDRITVIRNKYKKILIDNIINQY